MLVFDSAQKLLGWTHLPGLVEDLGLIGGHAYVADGRDGLRVIDIRDPANPVQVGFYDTIGEATGVVLSGSRAFVADGTGGLRVIDVSDPASPVQAGYYGTAGAPRRVPLSGSHVYLADGLDVLYILQFPSTGISDGSPSPAQLRSTLGRSSPNPFNPRATIPILLAQSGHARLAIYDLAGR